jgi:glycosyltransferase involved in cell wall biosynthesis
MEYKSLKSSNITCIIPFYNEDAFNLFQTIKVVNQINTISEIIVIDDGSKSKETYTYLKISFHRKQNIRILRTEKNNGKSYAIKYGLSSAFNENILLFDADLKNVDKIEIENAIVNYRLWNLEMLILRRINSLPLVKLIRADTLLSGERLIKKNHLRKILNSEVKGYELEIATNQYFINNKLNTKCRWVKSSAVNNYKFRKRKIIKGLLKDANMYFRIIKCVGIRNCIKQMKSFCNQSV